MTASPCLPSPCFHCGLPSATNEFTATILNEQRVFCCPGCLAVAQAITQGGLVDFYRLRRGYAPQATAVSDNKNNVPAYWDDAGFQQSFVTVQNNTQYKASLLISGMTCSACGWLIEKLLAAQAGVAEVRLNVTTHRLHVEWNPQCTTLSAIVATIQAPGYRVDPFSVSLREQQLQSESRRLLRQLGLAGLGMMQVMMVALGFYFAHDGDMTAGNAQWLRWTSLLLSLPIVIYSGSSFFIGAWRGLKSGHPGMDLPVALAILAAFVPSAIAVVQGAGEIYFDSAVMFIAFLLLGRYADMQLRHRAWQDFTASPLLPVSADVVNADGTVQEKPVASLTVSEQLRVRQGSVLPCDGVVISGEGSVDEAPLTGESLPVNKQAGAAVTAGTSLVSGSLQVRITALGQNTTLSQIEQLAERALAERTPLVLRADRIAGVFTVAMIALAALAWLGWQLFGVPAAALPALIAVLVVTCPCALSLATPAVQHVFVGVLRRGGVLVRSAQLLESVPRITDVIFDKTGTLTTGNFVCSGVVPLQEATQASAQQLVAALEQHSTHPIARAFSNIKNSVVFTAVQQHAHGLQGEYAGHHYRFGRAVFAAPNSTIAPPAQPADCLWLLLSRDDVPLAWFALHDELRADSAALVQWLHTQGKTVHLCSGDEPARVADVAQRTGITHFTASMSAQQKLDTLLALRAQGKVIMTVGDGFNDLPALGGADVAVVMGHGTDHVRRRGDCVLLADRLSDVRRVCQLAQRADSVIRQNIAWAVVYNAVCVPLAMFAMIPPWAAAIGMSLSSLLVVLNARRLA